MSDDITVEVVAAPTIDVSVSPSGAPGMSAYQLAVATGYVGTVSDWLESLTGPEGPQGVPGADGAAGAAGADGAPGAAGDDGADGESPELRVDSGFVQWKFPSDVSWTNLIAVSAITGPAGADGATGAAGADGADGDDGREVELQSNGTHIQWRYVGDVSWVNLVALSTLVGPQGDPGADGADGAPGADGADGVGVPMGGTTGQVLTKASGTDYDTEWGDPALAGGGGATIIIPPTVCEVGSYMPTVASAVAGSNVTISATQTHAFRFIPAQDMTADRAAVRVQTPAAGTIRLGLYEDADGLGREPGALIADWGTISMTGLFGGEVLEWTIDQDFTAGTIYWFAYCGSGTAPLFRSVSVQMFPMLTDGTATDALQPTLKFAASKTGLGALDDPWAGSGYAASSLMAVALRRSA